jgi:zinc protease
MKRYANYAFALLIAFCLLLPASAYCLEIKREILPNGLKILHSQRHDVPIVMVTLLIKASPFNEPPDKAGTAYMTSKMLTEGTVKRTSMQISHEIEFIGASLQASVGADFTTISLSVLKKDIDKGFDVFSDILLNPLFEESELNRRKDLTKGSLRRQEEEPSFVASKTFMAKTFGNHPYGRLITGDAESIDRISRDDIEKFYKDNYLPDNAVLSVVGDISSEELKALVEKYLGAWKGAKKTAALQRLADDKRQDDKSSVTLINKDLTQANIILGHKGISRDNPDYYKVSVMNYILGGGGFASRLMKTVRDELGLAYSIHSMFAANKEPGQFSVEVQTKNESANEVVVEIIRQMKRMRKESVSDDELKDAKAYLTGSFPRRFETSRKIADFLAAVEFYKLGDDYIEKYPQYINSVTKEDVKASAEKYLHPDNYVLVIVGNTMKIKLSDF